MGMNKHAHLLRTLGATVADDTTNTPAEQPDEAPEASEADHTLKHEFRGAVAKAVGIAVEAGSMLSGYAGEGVSAEGAVAEADTEDLIDRIDGEG
jgi:hypothetical protein